jgi:hypothetical protein
MYLERGWFNLYVNLYKSLERVEQSVRGYYVKFEGLQIEKKMDRTAFLQAIATSLARKGYDACVIPDDLSNNFDIVLLNVDENQVSEVTSKYSNLGPKFVKTDILRNDIVAKAWQNRVRVELARKGLLRIGDRYVSEQDIKDKQKKFKKAFRIQTFLISGFPSVFVDPRTRIMIPLGDNEMQQAETAGEESKIYVRVLPHWQRGILIGTTGKKAVDTQIPLGDKMFPAHEYWKIKHNIHFVSAQEPMLDVHVSAYERTLAYPESCVFAEFERKTMLPEDLKKDPHVRVQISSDFIRNYFDSINFLGQKILFKGPMAAKDLNYTEYTFPSQNSFQIIVGSGNIATVDGIHRALRSHGPYSGKLDGKYVVIHYGNRDRISEALKSLERAYSQLNLGKLAPLSSVGVNGFVDAGGESVADYTSTVAELRATFMEKREKVIAIIVLPDIYSSEIYFKSRGQLFERVFGAEPVPAQAISYGSLEKIIANDKSSYAICVNTAAQCYIKLGGTGTAAWILKDAADINIPGVHQGSSCYAYHDVSRRPKIKASATAYSALTDSYGRYIATGTKPVGGEKLTSSSFYDILVELLQKISIFSKRFGAVSGERAFSFKRLVFAKDGMLKWDEAEMMHAVIMSGLPEERKPPIPELLKKIAMLPKTLTIDIIGVNKTPNKRIFDRVNEHFVNVPEGTAISYDENNGLLVSCSSRIGTEQPIEISLHRHLCLNGDSIPKPQISQIMDEYYRLTFLNWSSIFKHGKYALPQILTQNLGENISAGVLVPDDMVLL